MRYCFKNSRLSSADESAVVSPVQDIDAIKQAVATDAGAVHNYTGAALDGVLANPGPGVLWLPRTASVSTSVSAATYNTADPIIWTGLDENGNAQLGYRILATAGGGDLLVARDLANTRDLAWTQVSNIYVPIQLGAGGFFSFGVEDILFLTGARSRFFISGLAAGGNLALQYDSGRQSLVPMVQGLPHVQEGAARVLGATTTAIPLTIAYDLPTPE